MGHIMSIESTYNQPDLRFEYEEEYEVTSKQKNRLRYTTLNLFVISPGVYVCVISGISEHRHEVNYVKYSVCKSPEEILKFFGYSYLSKCLYKKISKHILVDFIEVL